MKNNILKKLALSLLVASATTGAFAQGQVQFFTYNAISTTKGNIYLPATLGGLGVGAGYVAQLWISSTSTSASLFAFSPLETLTVSGAAANPGGVVNAGTLTVPWTLDPAYDPVSNPTSAFDAGNSIWYQVRVWNSAAGSTWATAIANPNVIAYGSSAIVKINSLGGTDIAGDPPTTPSAINGFNNFSLTAGAVPEPSSLALAGLGGFGMLMAFRRKKA